MLIHSKFQLESNGKLFTNLMEVAAEENKRSRDPHQHTSSQHSQGHW